MANIKTFITSKSIAIILLIAVFSIGFVSCKKPTQPSGYSQSVEVPGNGETGPVDPDPNPDPDNPDNPGQPEQPTFDEGSYINIFTPWVKGLEADGKWITNVSYQDTNTLNNLWKELIDGGVDNNGNRWFIRDGDNGQKDIREANYYYFDKNFDIVHAGKYADKVRLKQFLGGVIVKYSGGRQDLTGKTWTIGGLYKTVLNKETENSEGQQGYTKYDNNNLNEFMRSVHRWEEGDLSIILMNVGYDFGNNEYGVDEYYCTVDDNYRKNPASFIGVDPNTYLGTDINGYWEEKLNVRVNHSWQTSDKFNFKFVSAEPYAWHLE